MTRRASLESPLLLPSRSHREVEQSWAICIGRATGTQHNKNSLETYSSSVKACGRWFVVEDTGHDQEQRLGGYLGSGHAENWILGLEELKQS